MADSSEFCVILSMSVFEHKILQSEVSIQQEGGYAFIWMYPVLDTGWLGAHAESFIREGQP